MSISFLPNGNLAVGIHLLNWNDLVNLYGYNAHRLYLLSGLKMASLALRKYGCLSIYVDGSFVTQKQLPNDYDGCWDEASVDIGGLVQEFPQFLDLRAPRASQKAIFYGELFPSRMPDGTGKTMLDFFQQDRNLDPKGIAQINLNTVI